MYNGRDVFGKRVNKTDVETSTEYQLDDYVLQGDHFSASVCAVSNGVVSDEIHVSSPPLLSYQWVN